jgi:hypothetical protein
LGCEYPCSVKIYPPNCSAKILPYEKKAILNGKNRNSLELSREQLRSYGMELTPAAWVIILSLSLACVLSSFTKFNAGDEGVDKILKL